MWQTRVLAPRVARNSAEGRRALHCLPKQGNPARGNSIKRRLVSPRESAGLQRPVGFRTAPSKQGRVPRFHRQEGTSVEQLSGRAPSRCGTPIPCIVEFFVAKPGTAHHVGIEAERMGRNEWDVNSVVFPHCLCTSIGLGACTRHVFEPKETGESPARPQPFCICTTIAGTAAHESETLLCYYSCPSATPVRLAHVLLQLKRLGTHTLHPTAERERDFWMHLEGRRMWKKRGSRSRGHEELHKSSTDRDSFQRLAGLLVREHGLGFLLI